MAGGNDDQPVVTFKVAPGEVGPAEPEFKSPGASVYELALVLVDKIDVLLEHADRVRFHLKDQLDRSATAIVIQVARARGEPPTERRRYYRAARRLATDCVTILDILQRRHSAFADQLGPAQVVAISLVDQLTLLTHA